MALIKCHECGGQLSSIAMACPHCGATRKKRGWKLWGLVGLGLVVVAAVVTGPPHSGTTAPGLPSNLPATNSAPPDHTTIGVAAEKSRICLLDGCPIGSVVVVHNPNQETFGCPSQGISAFVEWMTTLHVREDNPGAAAVGLEKMKAAAGVQSYQEAVSSCAPLRDGQQFKLMGVIGMSALVAPADGGKPVWASFPLLRQAAGT